MYRGLFISDVHMSNALPFATPTTNGKTDRLEDQERLWDQVHATARNLKVDGLFVLGDLFDKAKVDPVTLITTVKALLKFDNVCRVYLLGGNHDANTTRGGRFSVEAFASFARYISVGTDPEGLDMGPVRFWPVEFMPTKAAMECLAKIRVKIRERREAEKRGEYRARKIHVLLTHLSVEGCSHGTWVCDDGITDRGITKDFHSVLTGHFHSHQTFGRLDENDDPRGMYLSAPMHHRFDDVGRDALYWTIDFEEDGTIKKQAHAADLPRFHELTWPDFGAPKGAKPGDYIKTTFKGSHAERALNVGLIETAEDGLRAEGYKVIPRFKPTYHHTVRIKSRAGSATLGVKEAVLEYPKIGDVDTTGLDLKKLRKLGREALEAVEELKPGESVVHQDILSIRAEDFCCFKDVTLSLDKRGLVWVSGENHDTAAATSNGAGKSTIFKALFWGLYGETLDMLPDAETGDGVIRDGATCAAVTLSLAGGWVVRRERRKGQPRVHLQTPSKEDWKAPRKEIDAKIVSLVGIDAQGFKNTLLFGNAHHRFLKEDDATRKVMLHTIARTTVLAKAYEWMKTHAKALRDEAEPLRREAQRHADELALKTADVISLRKDSKAWGAQRKERLEEAKAQAKDAVSKAKAVTVDTSEQEEELATVTRRIEVFREGMEAIEGLRESIESLNAAREATSKKAMFAASEHDSAAKKLRALDGDQCPVCSSDLASGAPLELKRTCEADMERLSGEIEAHRWTLEENQAELKRARGALRELDARAVELSALERQQDRLQQRIEQQAELAAVRRESLASSARNALAAAKAIAKEVNPLSRRIAETEERVKELEGFAETLKDRLREISADTAHATFWIKGFSSQGLPSFILDAVMPYLTERANHHLERLSDGDITMRFSTQRELKSAKGEYRDQINVSWEIEGLENHAPSGGQFKKMDLATDLALMDLAKTREGSIPSLLIMDECLDGLDGEGRERLLGLLHELRSERGSVFVISHNTDMSEVFERGIVAIKRAGVTTLKETE